jgi:hypothetical protein
VGHHTGGESHNRPLLLIPSLSLIFIFRSSVSLQVHTRVNFVATRYHFLELKCRRSPTYAIIPFLKLLRSMNFV